MFLTGMAFRKSLIGRYMMFTCIAVLVIILVIIYIPTEVNVHIHVDSRHIREVKTTKMTIHDHLLNVSILLEKNDTHKPLTPVNRIIKPFKYSAVKETQTQILGSEYFRKNHKSGNSLRYTFTIIPRNKCQFDTYLAIVVLSVPDHLHERDAIRKTWGSVAQGHKWPGSNVKINAKLFFVFGQSSNPSIENQLRLESLIHGDILQSSFHESYTNLTLKVLMSLRFVQQHCPSVKYVLKADEDSFTDMDLLVRLLKKVIPANAILGYIRVHEHVLRSGKYEITKTVYPLDVYPIYAQGNTYVVAKEVIPCLTSSASRFPYFRIEDAFITGVLGRTCNVTHIHVPGFAHFVKDVPERSVLIQGERITFYDINTDLALDMWHYLEDYHQRKL